MKSPLLIAVTLLSTLCSLLAADPTKPSDSEKPEAVEEASAESVNLHFPGIKNPIYEHVTFSPDKRLIACFHLHRLDEIISIHDAKSGKQIKRIVGHGDEVHELKFSPDGKLLASRCVNTGRAGWALWDVATGELILRLPVPPAKD